MSLSSRQAGSQVYYPFYSVVPYSWIGSYERIIAVYKENRTPEHKPKKVEEDGLKG